MNYKIILPEYDKLVVFWYRLGTYCLPFYTHISNRRSRRPYEYDITFLTAVSEFNIFRQKTITRMYRLTISFLSYLNYFIAQQITLRRRWRANVVGFVCLKEKKSFLLLSSLITLLTNTFLSFIFISHTFNEIIFIYSYWIHK